MGKSAASSSRHSRSSIITGLGKRDNDVKKPPEIHQSKNVATTSGNAASINEETTASTTSPTSITTENTAPPENAGSGGETGPKSFEFVFVTDVQSRKQVRRHAMRQYMRQRRLEGIVRLGSSRPQVSGWVYRGESSDGAPSSSPQVSPVSDTLEEKKKKKQNTSKRRASQASGGRRSVQSSPKENILVAEIESSTGIWEIDLDDGLESTMVSDPKASPSAHKLDPFDNYPLTISKSDQCLIHHFVSTYPLMMYKMSDAQQSNPIKSIFHRLALHDPVPFQAMLAVASKHRAGVEGQTDSVQSLTHKMRALRLINERLQSDGCELEDGTIYAAASMAVIEKWSKDPAVERMHFQGVRQLIRRRGGMSGLKATNKFLENVLYWVDFSCAPNAIIGASLPWTGRVPDTVPTTLRFLSPDLYVPEYLQQRLDSATYDRLDIARACEDFLSFFRSLHALQYSIISSAAPFAELRSKQNDLVSPHSNLIGPTAPLYSILATLPDYDHGIRDVRFIDEYTCITCLFYLNIALYDYYVKSRNFDEYLKFVDTEIRKVNPYTNPSISCLLWIFLNNGGYAFSEPSDEGERNWFVSRMVRVAKRLEWKRGGTLWEQLRAILFGFVTMQQECGIGREGIGHAELLARAKWLQNEPTPLWDEDEMRKDILGPLYSGPPVFSTPPVSSDPSVYSYVS